MIRQWQKLGAGHLTVAPRIWLLVLLLVCGHPASADSQQLCKPVANNWAAAVASGNPVRIAASRKKASPMRGACPDLLRRIDGYVSKPKTAATVVKNLGSRTDTSPFQIRKAGDGQGSQSAKFVTGKVIRRFGSFLEGRMQSVVFSPDGKRALTGSSDKTMRLWDLATGKELRRYVHDDRVEAVAFLPDGTHGISATLNNARLWNLSTGQELRRFEPDRIAKLVISADGTRMLIGSYAGTAQLWDVSTGLLIQKFEGHTGAISSLSFFSDSLRVMTASDDGTARFWNVLTGNELRRFEAGSDILSAALSPDGTRLLAGAASLILWDIATGKEIRRFGENSSGFNDIVFSPDGTLALVAQGKLALLWDIASGQEIRRLDGHYTAIFSVAFSPTGRKALTGSNDGYAQLWDLGLPPR
jgi:WD40 repeat protein